jgi:predicted deacetylase
VQFCIRDDDTSFFTTPEQLERAYGEVTRWGPVSLAVVPFHRAGTSKGVPQKFRGRWSTHALHDNRELVAYLRQGIDAGRYEVMLHGYYHDEPNGHWEFQQGHDLARRVSDGRKYLEDHLQTNVRVFVPPRNAIGRDGLLAIEREGLHLAGVAGVRSGWPYWSSRTWRLWLRLRRWRKSGGAGVPWVLDLGRHREIAGNAVTPLSRADLNEARFAAAAVIDGVFCAATHYWELDVPSLHADQPTVGEQLRRLIQNARANSDVTWCSVGTVLTSSTRVLP